MLLNFQWQNCSIFGNSCTVGSGLDNVLIESFPMVPIAQLRVPLFQRSQCEKKTNKQSSSIGTLLWQLCPNSINIFSLSEILPKWEFSIAIFSFVSEKIIIFQKKIKFLNFFKAQLDSDLSLITFLKLFRQLLQTCHH